MLQHRISTGFSKQTNKNGLIGRKSASHSPKEGKSKTRVVRTLPNFQTAASHSHGERRSPGLFSFLWEPTPGALWGPIYLQRPYLHHPGGRAQKMSHEGNTGSLTEFMCFSQPESPHANSTNKLCPTQAIAATPKPEDRVAI